MSNHSKVMTIREAVARCKSEGLPISEYCLRKWVKKGVVPVRWVGCKALVYYPALEQYLRCDDGAESTPPAVLESGGIRRQEVKL